jgi:hypothetical protein
MNARQFRSIGLLVALFAAAAAAQSTDPLQSPQCLAALDALQAREAASSTAAAGAGRASAPDAALQAQRRVTARACLGGRADPPPAPARFAQPPLAVPPVQAARPAAPATLRIEPVRPSPRQLAPPPSVTSCDAAGCWTSEGMRLHRVGPDLLSGPRGHCSVQGTLLHCP